jgi:hypothetical protein
MANEYSSAIIWKNRASMSTQRAIIWKNKASTSTQVQLFEKIELQ